MRSRLHLVKAGVGHLAYSYTTGTKGACPLSTQS